DLGLGELDRRAAFDRDGEGVEGPGLVARNQELAAVRRERSAEVEGGRQELLDRIAGDLGRRLAGLRGGVAGENENRQQAHGRDAEEAFHASLLDDGRGAILSWGAALWKNRAGARP